jgi:hypothetical protein
VSEDEEQERSSVFWNGTRLGREEKKWAARMCWAKPGQKRKKKRMGQGEERRFGDREMGFFFSHSKLKTGFGTCIWKQTQTNKFI